MTVPPLKRLKNTHSKIFSKIVKCQFSVSQISKLERDLEADWSRKLDRTLTLEKERHERALQEARDEKKNSDEKVELLEQKVNTA